MRDEGFHLPGCLLILALAVITWGLIIWSIGYA